MNDENLDKEETYKFITTAFRDGFVQNTGKSDWYYRLVENHRNVLDEVRQCTILSVGFLSDFSGDQIDLIEKPQIKVIRIYDALKYKYAPLIRKKSVVPNPQILKNDKVENYHFMDSCKMG